MKQRCWRSAVRCGDVHAQQRRIFPAPKPTPLVTHRSPERPEGRDSGFDCLIDLLQTVRQGVPAKLGGGGSVNRRGGGGSGKGWERGGRQLRLQSKEAVVEKVGDQKYQHPSMRYAGRGTGWEEREGRDRKKTTKQEKKGVGGRKRHRQHLEAHHRARRTTSEQTQHIKPTEQQTKAFLSCLFQQTVCDNAYNSSWYYSSWVLLQKGSGDGNIN